MLSHWVDISFRDFIRPWIFCDQAKGYQNQRGKSLMVPSVIDVLLAFSIDFAVGDPPRASHPVILMGRAIYMFESILRSPGKSERLERLAGTVLALSVICGSYVICKLVIELCCLHKPTGRKNCISLAYVYNPSSPGLKAGGFQSVCSPYERQFA